jgi:hypothetical protein
MTEDVGRDKALIHLRTSGLWKVIEDEVEAASARAGRRFAGFVTADDVKQVLWEWVLAAPKKIARWHDEKDNEGFLHILGAVLYDEANYFGRKARADQLGYRLGDEFYYTKGMLRSLLPSVYNKSEWSDPPKWAKSESSGRSGKALNEGGGWMATMADISRALSRIPKADQRVLFERYALGVKFAAQAADDGVSVSAQHGRDEAALKRLFYELGGPKWLTEDPSDREPDEPGRWPAGRRAMSNAEARYVTAKEMDFEKRGQREF